MLVCIDPGHSKNTPGKRSFDNTLLEYEFNRDVAKRLNYFLNKHGVETMYSCNIDIDEDTPLAQRVANANRAKADLFVSIHANAYGSTWNSANGWEIFIYRRGAESEKLAKYIHEESISSLGLKDRGVKTNNFVVIRDTKMPAVLIEHGFYTNLEEVAKLKDDTFREKCAIADAKGILKYAGIAYIEESTKAEPAQPTAPTGVPYQIRITCDALNVRGGPGVHYPRNYVIRDKKQYTIVEEQRGWGKLKSGAGWISLAYTEKV